MTKKTLLEKIKQNLNESRAYNNSVEKLQYHIFNLAYQHPHDDHLPDYENDSDEDEYERERNGGKLPKTAPTGEQVVERSARIAAKHMIHLHLANKLANNLGAYEEIFGNHSSHELTEKLANRLKKLSHPNTLGGQEKLMYLHDAAQNGEQDDLHELITHHLNAVLKSKK